MSAKTLHQPGRLWPRYLVQTDLRLLPIMDTDVLVLGGGVAGLSAAIEASRAGRVFVACKGSVRQSATEKAQGGIAAAWSGADSFEAHAADTMRAGCGLCHQHVVRFVVDRAPEEIRFLESLGAHFDMHNSRLDLGREGGHCARRIIHAGGDATGAEIMRVLLVRALNDQYIHLRENCFAIDLLTVGRRVVGALLCLAGSLVVIRAAVVVLATGGAAALFRDHTHPPGSTGDGMALALRAGAALRDLEMVQFHPTVFHPKGGGAFLISEAVRGEGARLVDADGVRFMPEYDERAELAPRDVVCRAIHDRLRRSKSPDVFLDVRHLDPDRLAARFPGIMQCLRDNGISPAHQLIPVRPAAHYTIGGVSTGLDARTNLDGLLACGEVASTGLHGANRLASNSLLEGLVFGRQAGMTAVQDLAGPAAPREEPDCQAKEKPAGDPRRIQQLREHLGDVIQSGVGIERDGALLEFTFERLLRDEDTVVRHHYDTVAAWETQDLWMLAVCTTLAAAWRRESRGAHFRTDFPEPDDARWPVHSRLMLNKEGVVLNAEPVPAITPQPVTSQGESSRENHHRTISNQIG